jgi:phosphoglycolate phosphatase
VGSVPVRLRVDALQGGGNVMGRWAAGLFDLDGTLVESRHDLATAINRMRGDLGMPPLPEERITCHIGWGARNLVARCLRPQGSPVPSPEPDPQAPSPEEVEKALGLFRRHYDDCLLDTTRPYEGIPELLEEAWRRQFPLAVVTNKPEGFTRKILAGLGLADPFAVVVGGDSAPKPKPWPDPLLLACQRLGVEPSSALMIGDSPTDLKAAREAGCPVALVAWGLNPAEALESLGPDLMVREPRDLAGRLWGNARS